MKKEWPLRSALSTCYDFLSTAKGIAPEAKEVKAHFLAEYADLFESNKEELANDGLSARIQEFLGTFKSKKADIPDWGQLSLHFHIEGAVREQIPVPEDSANIWSARHWHNVGECRIREVKLCVKYMRAQAHADLISADKLDLLADKAIAVEGMTEDSTIAESFKASGGRLKDRAA